MNDLTKTGRGTGQHVGALAVFGVLLGVASVAVPGGEHAVGNA
jgi:hypothetical protein